MNGLNGIEPGDVAASCDHVTSAINAAEVVVEPFPHMVISEFLPDRMYRQLLATWPPDDLLTFTNSMRRRQLTLATALDRLPPGIRPFWSAVQDLSEIVNRQLVARFRPYLGHKLATIIGSDWARVLDECSIGVRGTVLAGYTGEVELLPHTDHIRILTNAFLYCSEAEGREDALGTWLYRSLGLSLPTNVQLKRRDLEMCLRKHTLVPYQRNTCLAYINGPTSFHGVDRVDIGARQRRLCMFNSRLGVRDLIRIAGEAFVI